MAKLENGIEELRGKSVAKENGNIAAFSKAQLLASKRYCDQRDLLEAILADKPYTIQEVDNAIQQFMKSGVN